jgi:hypothetical protein
VGTAVEECIFDAISAGMLEEERPHGKPSRVWWDGITMDGGARVWTGLILLGTISSGGL